MSARKTILIPWGSIGVFLLGAFLFGCGLYECPTWAIDLVIGWWLIRYAWKGSDDK